MSVFADRETIVTGFTIGTISIAIGCITRFTGHGALDNFYSYLLVAAGIVLIFASSMARRSSSNAKLLRYVLGALAIVMLVIVLLKDVLAGAV